MSVYYINQIFFYNFKRCDVAVEKDILNSCYLIEKVLSSLNFIEFSNWVNCL